MSSEDSMKMQDEEFRKNVKNMGETRMIIVHSQMQQNVIELERKIKIIADEQKDRKLFDLRNRLEKLTNSQLYMLKIYFTDGSIELEECTREWMRRGKSFDAVCRDVYQTFINL